jgi:fumarate reductase flavoprotein subunit
VTTDVDVVVSGAGAAGAAAALSAADRGLSVALIEANEHFRRGCNTAMSTSMVPAGGSRWQAEVGIEDSPDRFFSDIMRKTKGQADPVLARALTAVAPELVALVADCWGVSLDLVTDFRYPGHSADRCHAVPDRSGETLHRYLLDAVATREEVTFAVPLRLDSVEVDRDTSAAFVSTPSGESERIAAKAVVLATNGFAANEELVKRYIPEIADGLYHGGDGSTGDALRIGESLGADTAYLDAYQGHGSVVVPHRILLTWAFVMHGGYLINREGDRFGDETTGYSEFGPIVCRQPGAIAYAVYDRRIHSLLKPFADYRSILNTNAIRWVADAGGVAAAIGAEPDRVAATMAAADAVARGEADDPLGRAVWEAPLESPFAVLRVTGALFHTQGGLKVDGRGRVLRGGEPIPGLYAAGGAAHSISGHDAGGYLAGNGLLPALGLGLIAGRDIRT